MLSPRDVDGTPEDLLSSFTSGELLAATIKQVTNGIRRRIRNLKS
jgi:hypothetical protein